MPERIKPRDAALAAIFVTAVDDRNLARDSLRRGTHDLLDKPGQISVLLRFIAAGQLLDTHRGLAVMHRLHDALRVERSSATNTMDFNPR